MNPAVWQLLSTASGSPPPVATAGRADDAPAAPASSTWFARDGVALPSSEHSVGTWQAAIQAAAAQTGVPAALLSSVMRQESGGNPWAVSPVGAIGLMQLMPATAAGLGVNPWNPAQNILGGARYLAEQLARFQGNVPDALAAYNAGPGAVQRYGGVPPYAQTEQYVANVLALYQSQSA